SPATTARGRWRWSPSTSGDSSSPTIRGPAIRPATRCPRRPARPSRCRSSTRPRPTTSDGSGSASRRRRWWAVTRSFRGWRGMSTGRTGGSRGGGGEGEKPVRTTVMNQRGSAILLAVLGMLVMGVLSTSFWLLADLESRVGVGYGQLAQAEAAAEAGLERARDLVRAAATAPGGVTGRPNGGRAGHLRAAGETPGGARYWARIDNDCPPAMPAAIREGADRSPAPACTQTADTNDIAVITAWAVAGAGRARARAAVAVDNPWRRVCSG